MSTTDFAYLAGLIDGEGTISIRRTLYKRASWNYFVDIKFGMTSKSVMEWACATFGGRLCRRPETRHHKALYIWERKADLAAETLQRIAPYLRLKCFQCSLALAFHSDKNSSLHGPHSIVSLSENSKRERYRLLMKRINDKKGQLHGTQLNEWPQISKEEETGYLAALIDAEGGIGLTRAFQRLNGKKKPSPHHSIFLECTMTSSNIIRWVAMKFSGNVRNRIFDTRNRKPCFVTTITGNHAVSVIQDIFPYLKGKHFQAMMIQAYQHDRTPTRQGHGVTVPQHEILKRDGYYEIMRRLNRRGVFEKKREMRE